MNRVDQYRDLLKTIFAEHRALGAKDSFEPVETQFIVDDHDGQYLMSNSGGRDKGKQRVYGVVFHARLSEGKFYIEQDMVLPSVTQELLVATGDIVFALNEPVTA